MALRCLIVDDSGWVLAAARLLLEQQGVTVVGVASSAGRALELVHELRPDVTLIDVDLGGESGFELARQLEGAGAILTSTRAAHDYGDLIDASPALGFLPKAELSADAIRALLAGAPGPSRRA
jgi:DNA-binding NarL/FixJ family response regulator